MKSAIQIYSMSDIHLGHPQLPVTHLIDNLNTSLPDDIKLAHIDLLLLCGDVFDELLNLPDEIVAEIQIWMVRLLRLCKKWDIVLRVLEGTPKHDRRQSKQFSVFNTVLNIEVDFQYVNTLSIEYIDKLDIHMLYVPDEWRASTEQTKQEVMQLLQAHNLSQVDFAAMHGYFPHQLPAMLSAAAHDPEFYLGIVRKYIFIGHVHIPTVWERIIAHGSHGRYNHGEEHPKGFFHVCAYPNDTLLDTITFIANKNAARFMSISVVGLSAEEVEYLLADTVAKGLEGNLNYHIPVHIQVISMKGDSNEDTIHSYRKSYPLIKWKAKHEVEKSVKGVLNINTYIPLVINNNTIVDIMRKRLSAFGVNEVMLTDVLETLNTIKEV